jgi:hypothetical protein
LIGIGIWKEFISKIFRIEIGKMEIVGHNFVIGSLHKDVNGKFIACKGGKVYYKFKLWNPEKK